MATVFGRFENYKGGTGAAAKEKIYSLDADSINDQFFPMDQDWLRHGKQSATDYLTHKQLISSQARDFAMDIKNPREEMPKNPLDIHFIEQIPQWDPQMIDISTPMDYAAKDNVYFLQKSNQNWMNQENLFTDSKLIGKEELNTDRQSKRSEPMTQKQFYNLEGSAAGHISNRFDEDGARVNSISSTVAF